jgi:hypothetical protein
MPTSDSGFSVALTVPQASMLKQLGVAPRLSRLIRCINWIPQRSVTRDEMLEQAQRNSQQFVWDSIQSVEELGRI